MITDEIKVLLGENLPNFTDEQISLFAKQAILEVSTYTNREVVGDPELEMVAEKVAILHLNRLNSEGLGSYSAGGVSESYIDGYPANILTILNRRRRIKVV